MTGKQGRSQDNIIVSGEAIPSAENDGKPLDATPRITLGELQRSP